MTSPLVQKRNALALQNGGIAKSVLPVGNSAPSSILQWQKQDELTRQQQAATHDIAARQAPINDTLDTGLANANQTTTQIRQIGTDETARVAQQQAARQQAASQQTSTGSTSPGGITVSQGIYQGNDANLADIARAGGFQEKDIPMAIAIMKAESGGNPRAVNNSNRNGSTDTGIFQINSVHSNWTKQYDLYDPVQNAKAAFKIFSDAGGKWTPWSTFSNGSAQKLLKTPSSYSPAPNMIAPYAVSTATGLRGVAVQDAMHVIGLPYVWGGNSLSKGVDCSGLVQQVYKQVGIPMPRTADQQSHSAIGVRAPINTLKPGDLIAWQGGWRGPNYVGHIAIYAGNGEIIEAPHTGANVRRRALKPGEAAFGVHITFPGEK